MSITTGKVGSVYTINDITAFGPEATTEAGSTKVYQITDTGLRVWDPNTAITISTGTLDTSYFDSGVNWFEGKVKLTASGEGALTVSGSNVSIQAVGKVYGFSLNITIDTGEVTEIGDTWKQNLPLGRSASVTLSRYRFDTLFDQDESGYQEVGLSDKELTTATGLGTTTQYWFKVNDDGNGETEYDITTGADATYEPVLVLMNAEVSGVASFALVNGDLRCTSDSDGSDSTIALAAGATGTDLFATLTGWSDFDEAVAGSEEAKYVLLKLFEDGDSGFWVKALRTSLGITKGIGAVDDESTSFEVDANVYYF